MVDSTTTLSCALSYAARGWSVVPVHAAERTQTIVACSCSAGIVCRSPGKHPALDWRPYQFKAADAATLHSWFESGRTNVGIVTGAVSGNIFVVDIDSGEGKPGEESWRTLQLKYGDADTACEVQTGSGGRHLFFRAPPGAKIKTGKNVLGPGVDVRGEGGFVVAPPSGHASGGTYRWISEGEPDPSPDWLTALAREDADSSLAAEAGVGGQIVRNSAGKVVDGRELYALEIVSGAIIGLIHKLGRLPSGDEVWKESWPTYERNTACRGASLESDGRGQTMVRAKIGNQLRAAMKGTWVDAAEALESILHADESVPLVAEPLPIRTWSDIRDAKVHAPDDFVQGLLVAGQIGIVYGPSHTGKTFWVLDLAFHVATGTRWRGKRVDHGAVVFLGLEGQGGLDNRVKCFQLSNPRLARLNGAFAIPTAPADMKLLSRTEVEEVIATIKYTAERFGIPVRLVVVDTLAKAMNGLDENSAEGMGAVTRAAQMIADATGANVLLIHHTGKNVDNGARGHSSLKATIDYEVELVGKSGVNGGKMVVRKNRDLQKDERGYPFLLRQVQIGTNRHSEPVTSCVIEQVVEGSPEAKALKPHKPKIITGTNNIIVWGFLLKAMQESAIQAPPNPTIPPAINRVVLRATIKQHLKAENPDLSDKSVDTSVGRALRDLKAKWRLVGFDRKYVWLTQESDNDNDATAAAEEAA